VGQFSALTLQFNFKYQKHSGHLCVNIGVPTIALPADSHKHICITKIQRCKDT